MKLDLHSLRHVVALARHGHYGRAATALNITQPALSRSIAGLEQILGVRLFERSRRGARPTILGELLVARGELLIRGAAELEAELLRQQGLEMGQLRVGAGLFAAEISVGSALGRLGMLYPGLRVSLLSEPWRNVAEATRSGSVDVAVLELSSVAAAPGLTLEPLPAHEGLFVCRPGHPLLRRGSPDLPAILEYPLVGPKLPSRVGAMLAEASSRTLVDEVGDYVPALLVEVAQLAKQVVMAGDGVAIFPAPIVAAELAAGVLVDLGLRMPWLRTNHGFAYLRDRPLSPPVLAFMAEVRRVEAEVAARTRVPASP
ncbi:MAG: LysR family transcriptional regulator [Methylococcus sp.]|nr:MAG: LysR family transcriptional regulator [Methylococcus sp.]